MSELDVKFQEEGKIYSNVFPLRFKIAAFLLCIIVLAGIPAILISHPIIIGFISTLGAIASLVIFAKDFLSPNRKNTISGYFVIINLLVIYLVIFCSFQSYSVNVKMNKEKMKYHMMNLAYFIETEKQITGKYPGSATVYEKYRDKLHPERGTLLLYLTFHENKGFGIEGGILSIDQMVFNSEFSQLGVINSWELPKEGRWWEEN